MLTIIGKKLDLVYETGWEYKIYYENDHHVQNHVVSGPAGGRFADQEAMYAEVAPGVFNIVWYEETGTVVSQIVNLNARIIHGFVAFPPWVGKIRLKPTAESQRSSTNFWLCANEGLMRPASSLL